MEVMLTHLINGFINKILLYNNGSFPPYGHSKNKIEAELYLCNYTTKSDIKTATGIDTSQFTKEYELANLKTQVDKLNIDKLLKLDDDKLSPIPNDLSKLSDIVKDDAVNQLV